MAYFYWRILFIQSFKLGMKPGFAKIEPKMCNLSVLVKKWINRFRKYYEEFLIIEIKPETPI